MHLQKKNCIHFLPTELNYKQREFSPSLLKIPNMITYYIWEGYVFKILHRLLADPPVVEVSPSNITTNESVEVMILCTFEANPTALSAVRW